MERLSYLHARDYSLGGDFSETFDPRKNLNEIFKTIPLDEVDVENLPVYLRVRPKLAKETGAEETQVDILDDNSIVLTAPSTSNTFKNSAHGIANISHKFTFSKIFGTETAQKYLFDSTTLDLVREFMNGRNCLLFTYGATNSGKTYTVQGTAQDAGILPRTLEVLFNNIGEKQYPHKDLKPRYFCDVVRIDERDVKKEEEIKEAIFKISCDLSSTINSTQSILSISKLTDTSLDASVPSIQDITTASDGSSVVEVKTIESLEETSIEVVGDDENSVYAIFVSFAEIYNEYIYDLLEKMPASKKMKRSALMLGEDRNGAIYIKGLREVRVHSCEEAMRLVDVGRQNLHFATTKLNHNSSRSHCIFNVKVIRMADANHPHVARVSQFSMCDLAGAERSAKTKGTQERVKEAGNINTSLLVLSRCIEALRKNQQGKKQKKAVAPVPYRDSKLTRLFQSFFLGRGKVSMIINISKMPYLFDETLQVLKFSAIAKQVAIQKVKVPEPVKVEPPRRNSQFSKFLRQSFNTSKGRLSVPWAEGCSEVTFGGSAIVNETMASVAEEEEEDDERYEALVTMIETLKDKLLKEHKEKMELETKVRNELCKEFSEQMVEIEDRYSQRLKETQARAEELTEWRVNAVMKSAKKVYSRKRLRPEEDPDDEYVSSIELHREQIKIKEKDEQISDLETECTTLNEQVEAMKKSLKKTSEVATRSQAENAKLTFQLAQLTQNYDKSQMELSEARRLTMSSTTTESLVLEEMQRRLEDANSSLAAKENEIKELKDMVVEAAEEFFNKEQEVAQLNAKIYQLEKDKEQQSIALTELEQQVTEAREVVSQLSSNVDERDNQIEQLTEEQQAMKKMSSAEENELALQKKLMEVEAQKQQIEDDYLREKSKLLLEVASLKRSDNSSQLENALKENEVLKQEKEHHSNQLTESKELFNHMQLSTKLLSVQESRATDQLDLSSLRADALTVDDLKQQVDELQKQVGGESIISNNAHQEVLFENEALKQQVEGLKKTLDEFEKKVSIENENSVKSSDEKYKEMIEKYEEDIRNLQTKLSSISEDLSKKSAEIEEMAKEKELNSKAIIEKENSKKISDEIHKEMIEKYEEDIRILQTKLSSTSDDLSRKSTELEEIKKEKEQLNAKVFENENSEKISDENHKELIEKYEVDIRNLQAKLSSMSDDLSNKSAKLEEMAKEKEQLNAVVSSSLSDLESKKEQFDLDIKNLKSEKDSLKAQLEDVNKAASDKSQELNVQLQEITKQLDEANNKISIQESELKSQIETLTRKIEDQENNMKEELQKEKVSLANENEKLKQCLEKMQENNKSLNDKTKENDIFIQALKDNNKKLTSRIEELEEKSEIEIIPEETAEKEAEIQSHKEKIAELFIEKTHLEDKYTAAKNTIDAINKAIAEKDEVISALNVKVSNLDSKLDNAEEELTQQKQELDLQRSLGTDNNTTLDMDNFRDRCQVLEKEIAALREARQEETRELQGRIQGLQDAQTDKEKEITTLQQELKKMIQSSSIVAPATPSVQHIPLTPKIKPETTDKDNEISALEDQVRRSESERMSLVSEVTQLRNQLEESSKLRSQLEETQQRLSSMNIQDSLKPPQSAKRNSRKTVTLDTTSQNSDNELFATPFKPPSKTPAKSARSNRKKDFVPTTPTESLHLALFPSEDEQTPAVSSGLNARSGRPVRSSRSIYVSRKSKMNSSFEYEPNSESDKLTEDEEDLFGNDADWAPEPEAPKLLPSRNRNTRTKSRKKKDDIYNPHLDQENKNKDKLPLLNKDKSKSAVTSQVLQETNIIVNPHINNKNSSSMVPSKADESQESDSDFQNGNSKSVTKSGKQKRRLFRGNDVEPFECEPNMIELPPADSPHSVVRRQLRTKKK